MADVEHDKLCLCWSFYTFMVDNLFRERDSFIIAYGLNSEEGIRVANSEGIKIQKEDMSLFQNFYNEINEVNIVEDEIWEKTYQRMKEESL